VNNGDAVVVSDIWDCDVEALCYSPSRVTMALSCIISGIKRDIGRKSYPLRLTPQLWGLRRNIAIPFEMRRGLSARYGPPVFAVLFGVPQSSVLGPLLYVLYTAELFHIVAHHRLRLHNVRRQLPSLPQHASQGRGNRSRPPLQLRPEINDWMTASRLRLNPTKTQVMWLGSSQQLDKVVIREVSLLSTCVTVVDTARDLGVVLDRQLSLDAHVTAVCSSGYYQLRQLRPITRSLSVEAAKSLVQAFISSRLDYCNAILHGLPDRLMRRLQSV